MMSLLSLMMSLLKVMSLMIYDIADQDLANALNDTIDDQALADFLDNQSKPKKGQYFRYVSQTKFFNRTTKRVP